MEGGKTLIDTQEILDSFPFYVMLIDSEHRIHAANKMVKEALGVAPEQIIGGYCPKVIHGLDEPFPGCPLEEAVEKGQMVDRDFYEPTSKRWKRSEVYPVTSRPGEGKKLYLHYIRDITEEKRAKDELQQSSDTHDIINILLMLSLANILLDEVLQRALNLISGIPWLAFELKGAIFLVEDEPEVLVMKAQNNLAPSLLKTCARIHFGECLCGRAAQGQEIQYASQLDERHETHYEGMMPHGHYCVPFTTEGKTLGVIVLYLKEGRSRNERDLEFLTAVGNALSGIVIRRRAEEGLKESYTRLQKTFYSTVQALASIGEKRDSYTAGHQVQVTRLALAIAEEMGLEEERKTALRFAATLHDIGKIAVPLEILSKPGRISELEFGLVQMHPQVTYDILHIIEFPWPVAEIARQHHERIDGSGYPQGLKGDAILQEARILGVADVVEAMSSHRPYRPALGVEAALREIDANRNRLYDSAVVDACIKVFREKGFRFEQAHQ